MIKIFFSSIIISNHKNILILRKGENWTIPSKTLKLKDATIDIICKEIEEIIGIALTIKECISTININEIDKKKKEKFDFQRYYLFNIKENEIIVLKKESGFSDGKWIPLKQIDYYLKDNNLKNYIKKIETIME